MRSILATVFTLAAFSFATAASAQATFPLFDDVEDSAQSESYWTPNDPDQASILETGAGTARSGTHVWELLSGGEIFTSESVDLSGTENPYVSFWARYSDYWSSLQLQVSTDDGATWQNLYSTSTLAASWSYHQVSLEEYRVPDVRLRFEQNGNAAAYLDDILFDNAPFPQSVLLSEPGNHQVRVSWGESTADDFEAYRVVLATNQNDLGYFDRHSDRGSSWIRNDEQRIQFEVDEKATLDTLLTDLYFFNRRYYAKVYERDTQGLYNKGTDTNEITTSFNVATEVAPFVQDFEGEHGWAANGPWAVTDADADEAGHSAERAMEDSPGGLYLPNKEKRLVVRVDFSGVERPMLRFNHRYQFADDYDHGEVWLSTEAEMNNNQLGTRLARFRGTRTDWQAEEIDLGQVNALSESQTAFLIFWINTNNSSNYDGWHLDDVQVLENSYAASFPFFDQVEDRAVTEARWIEQTSAVFETGEGTAYSGTHVWTLGPYDQMTLGGSVDLSGTENPYVSFWARYSDYWSSLQLQVSTDDGATWQNLYSTSTLAASWSYHQVSLEEYRVPDVRLRFEQNGNAAAYLDDILFSGDFPANAVSVDPGTVQFEPLEVGEADTIAVTIFNPGTETLTGLVSQLDDDALSIVAGDGGFSLAAGEQHIVRVRFAPAADTSYTGVLSIAHSGTNEPSPLEVTLRGRTPGAVTCLPITLAAGWNMVSVPVRPTSLASTDVFPGTTNHFAYDESYASVDRLTLSEGYWLKSADEQTVDVCGDPLSGRTMALAEGWNLIGPFDQPVATSSITTDETAALGSSFFGYEGSYQPVTTLTPGYGYWIKADAAGTITLGGAAAKKSARHAALLAASTPTTDWLRLEVEDAEGRTGTLYLAETVDGTYVLPPPPPAEVFDVRFATDQYVAPAQDGAQTVQINGAAYPLTLRAANVGEQVVTVTDALGADLLSGTLGEDQALVLDAPVGPLAVTVADALPERYALEQNYPNPFNPRTTIRYSLPEQAHVTVAVYNLLGEQVALLVDEQRTAGHHEVGFEARDLASGVYFFRIRAGTFQAVRQMILLK